MFNSASWQVNLPFRQRSQRYLAKVMSFPSLWVWFDPSFLVKSFSFQVNSANHTRSVSLLAALLVFLISFAEMFDFLTVITDFTFFIFCFANNFARHVIKTFEFKPGVSKVRPGGHLSPSTNFVRPPIVIQKLHKFGRLMQMETFNL